MKKLLFLLLCISNFAIHAISQCPSNLSASVTPADCPTSGTITILPAPGADVTATYRITSGPSGGGYQTTEQTSNTFSGLPAGNYTILVKCGGNSESISANVANNYTPINSSVVVTNVCTIGETGGVITVNATGGSGTLSYAILKTNNANTPDNQFSYSSSNVFDVSEFGTYQVRVKDACNNFITNSVQILESEPRVNLTGGSFVNLCSGTRRTFSLRNDNNTNVNVTGKNYQLEVWHNSGSNTCGGSPSGQPTTIQTLTGTSVTLDFPSGITSAFWRVTSPCGVVKEGCISSIPQQFNLTATVKIQGCANGDNYFGFEPNTTLYPFSVLVNVYDANNNLVGNTTQSNITNTNGMRFLVQNGFRYTYTITDGCGRAITGERLTSAAATATVVSLASANCPNTNPVNFSVRLNNYFPNITAVPLADMTITNNATNAVYTATGITNTYNRGDIRFTNVEPGIYTLRINVPSNAGDCDMTLQNIVVNGASIPVTRTLTAGGSVTQLCGGTGTINATSIGTLQAVSTITYALRRTGQTAILATNTTGLFQNLPSGDYTVTVSGTYSRCGNETLESAKNFTITPSGSGPVIRRKLGVTCDNGTTGVATLLMAGASPFRIEMKRSSEGDDQYQLLSEDGQNEYVKSGLEPNITYDFRIMDQCGITTTTQVVVQPIANITRITTLNPCVGENYTLAVEEIAGAEYEWSYNGAIIGNGHELSFTPYQTGNDGEYVVTVKIGTCITREVRITTNSKNCGQPLSVTFGTFNAFIKDNILFVNWTSLSEENNALYEIEVSQDGTKFTTIGSRKSLANKGNSSGILEYSFSITLNKAIAGLFGLGFLSLLSLTGISRRKKILWILIPSMIVFISTFSCNKKSNDVINKGKDAKLYVRLAVTDKEGIKSYSKVIRVVVEE